MFFGQVQEYPVCHHHDSLNSQYRKGDFPQVFEFPQSEYGERKIIEVDGSYHYSELAPGKPNKDIPQSKVDQSLQFYHHLPARYRNCAEIMDFIKFTSKNDLDFKFGQCNLGG